MKKLNIGDEVDYVNDFGVLFKGHRVIELDTSADEESYFINTDCHWVSKKRKNLYSPGTYKRESRDIKLRNGIVAIFDSSTFFGEPIYKIEDKRVVMIDSFLYSMSQCDEPISHIEECFQPL